MFELHGKTIVLRPVKIQIINYELQDFARLGEQSFSFWDNQDDDIYQEFYK